MKNGLPGAGQDKDAVTAVQRVSVKNATKFHKYWQACREKTVDEGYFTLQLKNNNSIDCFIGYAVKKWKAQIWDNTEF